MKRAHYLAGTPALAWPVMALVLNAAFLGWAMYYVRATPNRVRVTVAATHDAAASAASSLPVLSVSSVSGDEEFRLEDEVIAAPLDLEFRLADLAGKGSAIVLRVSKQTPPQTIARLMQICSQAGFADLLLEVEP